MPEYRVLRIEEQMYGCEELPAGQPVLCDVVLEGTDGACCTLPCPDKELTRLGIDEGSRVHLLPDGTLQKISEELLRIRSELRPSSVWGPLVSCSGAKCPACR